MDSPLCFARINCSFRSRWFAVRESGSLGCPGGDLAEPDDLFMLGGEPGQGLAAEVGELVEHLLGLGEPFPEIGVLRLEPGDPGLREDRGSRRPRA